MPSAIMWIPKATRIYVLGIAWKIRLRRSIESSKARGDAGVDAILTLIHHSNPNVRYSAIVDCLCQRTKLVLPALEQMAQSSDFLETKIDAEDALRMWRERKWVVD
jgi:hypothetical protein